MQAWRTGIFAAAAPSDGSYALLGTATGQILQLPTSIQQQSTDRQELSSVGSFMPEPSSSGTQGCNRPNNVQPRVSARTLVSEAVNNPEDVGYPFPGGVRQADAAASSTIGTDHTSPCSSSPPGSEETVLSMLPHTHSSAVTSLVMSGSGLLLASLSASDGVIMLWQATPDAEQNFMLLTKMVVNEAVCVAWMPDVPQQGPAGLLIGTTASQLLVCFNSTLLLNPYPCSLQHYMMPFCTAPHTCTTDGYPA